MSPHRILLLKPYQNSPTLFFSPPLGLLSLAANLREKLGDDVAIEIVDMKLHRLPPEWLPQKLEEFKPDIVGVSALNYEGAVSHRIAHVVHQWNPQCITALGGPYALHQSGVIFGRSEFDWIFEGAADRTFPEAVRRHLGGELPGSDLPGFSWRNAAGGIHLCSGGDNITDLDSLPMPAWDLCDFKAYANKPTFNPVARSKPYALLFTSRGCPYQCCYCHDIFTKKFHWQSASRVLEEISLLYNEYGITEFQIVDDIFNLHKPRLQQIMKEVDRRWPGKMSFSFPNGLRADILEQQNITAMVKAGTYFVALAVETATPRLQQLIMKNLDLEKTRWAIDEFDRQGVTVAGFFMLGFPGETPEEMKATVSFARDSRVSIANFFSVVPQPKTPLHAQALAESPEALAIIEKNELEGGSYRNSQSWYSLAYQFDLDAFIREANWKTYSKPSRIVRLLWRWPKKSLLMNAGNIVAVIFPRNKNITAQTQGLEAGPI